MPSKKWALAPEGSFWIYGNSETALELPRMHEHGFLQMIADLKTNRGKSSERTRTINWGFAFIRGKFFLSALISANLRLTWFDF
jgi:hypothetical protein